MATTPRNHIKDKNAKSGATLLPRVFMIVSALFVAFQLHQISTRKHRAALLATSPQDNKRAYELMVIAKATQEGAAGSTIQSSAQPPVEVPKSKRQGEATSSRAKSSHPAPASASTQVSLAESVSSVVAVETTRRGVVPDSNAQVIIGQGPASITPVERKSEEIPRKSDSRLYLYLYMAKFEAKIDLLYDLHPKEVKGLIRSVICANRGSRPNGKASNMIDTLVAPIHLELLSQAGQKSTEPRFLYSDATEDIQKARDFRLSTKELTNLNLKKVGVFVYVADRKVPKDLESPRARVLFTFERSRSPASEDAEFKSALSLIGKNEICRR